MQRTGTVAPDQRVMSCVEHTRYTATCEDCRAKCRTYFRKLRFYARNGFRPCRDFENCPACSRLIVIRRPKTSAN